MENALNVEKYLYNAYLERFGHKMDQMKMHKLMYFSQRESLMYNKKLLFDEDFYGWKFGPILYSVRSEYLSENLFANATGVLSDDAKKLVDSVLERYGSLSAWKLSSLSHREYSWKCSRKGLEPSDNGNVKLNVKAIGFDAVRELLKRQQTEKNQM